MLCELENIKALMSEKGLHAKHYKDPILKRKVQSRMKANKIIAYADYIKLLENNEDERAALMNSLMINFTEFFRDSPTFGFFRDGILPVIQKRGKKSIRVWSIGCSTGEEPYSLAMLAKEAEVPFSITATDTDRTAVDMARSGEYEDRKLNNIKKQYLKFFELIDDKYKIKKDIRSMVRFFQHDIFSERLGGYFDVVFCRNMLIYLSRNAQLKVLERIYSSLNREGFLILGKTEFMPRELRDKFILTNLEERVYRKR